MCSNTCCNVSLPPVKSKSECIVLDEPDKLMKYYGSKIIKCEQESMKDPKKTCKLGYFKDTCKKSCCEAGFPPVDSHPINSKCVNSEQPKKVMKDSGLEKN